MEKNFKYLGFITAFFVTVLLVSNITSTKLLILGPFTFDGGTILFPLSYIFGDVLTEVYGYARSRRVIWTGFLMMLLASVVFAVVGFLPAATEWPNQQAYDLILGVVPRIFLASIVAYFAGEFSNSYLLAKLKVKTAGKYLWMRTIGSTLLGQGIDTSLFLLIAFVGVYDTSVLFAIFISNYVFKVAVEVVFTPLTYVVTGFLKKREHEDFYDEETNFSPFALEVTLKKE